MYRQQHVAAYNHALRLGRVVFTIHLLVQYRMKTC